MREWFCWVAKGVLASGLVYFVNNRSDRTLLVTGLIATVVAHLVLDRFRCPRCQKSFARYHWLEAPFWRLSGNGYAALVWPVRKCANCGLRCGAETWLSVEEEEKRREQMRREIRRERKRVLVSRSKE